MKNIVSIVSIILGVRIEISLFSSHHFLTPTLYLISFTCSYYGKLYSLFFMLTQRKVSIIFLSSIIKKTYLYQNRLKHNTLTSPNQCVM